MGGTLSIEQDWEISSNKSCLGRIASFEELEKLSSGLADAKRVK